MKNSSRRLLAGIALLGVLSASHVTASPDTKPTIVLVHGAFADGSSWNKVIPILQAKGYSVIAVQNPLTSFADDVATTRRVIDGLKGPVVAVGHSYGGAVISTAARDAANVKSLVYIAAFAPDGGESLQPLLQKYPADLGGALVPDAAGFLTIDPAKFKAVFAADVPVRDCAVMAATQKPVAGAIFGQVFEAPAWKQVPTWYMVATQDHAINPDLERFFAKRMGATTKEVTASHVVMVSKPEAVVAMIEAAASAAPKTATAE